jgi:tetratricopeptide (TPR) repeat protein
MMDAYPATTWNTNMVRRLLAVALDEQELQTLCYDHFRPVYEEKLGAGMSKGEKIQRLLEYCDRHAQLDHLVSLVARLNPNQYKHFERRLHPQPSQKREVPFQVPSQVDWFVGREAEVDDLCQTLAGAARSRVCCLTGMGGIGKTALAIHVAHVLRSHFADGVLWAHAATSAPLAIVDSWAQAYGSDFSHLPDLNSRAAALRGLLADKKVLVILDDVRNVETARPLFPGSTSCAVLLTTRDLELAEALTDCVYQVSALSPLESFQLLSRILHDDERVTAEKAAADEICRLLMNLPLAVEIAAQRLASHKHWKLVRLAGRLRDQSTRLSELKIRDREVRTSIAVSWEALDENLRNVFASLAVFEGRAFTSSALATVAGIDTYTAEDSLDSLVALSLVFCEDEGDHFWQHPLLADFAREHLEQDQAAYVRMAQYFLGFAKEHRLNCAALEEERSNLVAGMKAAFQHKEWQVVVDYADTLTDAWFTWGYYTEARQGYAWACEAARALESPHALASCLLQWGRACIEQADYPEAKQHLSHSLQICQELGDQRSIASVHYYQGYIGYNEARYAEAQRELHQAQEIYERLADQRNVAGVLYMLALTEFDQYHFETAERLGEQALRLQQAANDPVSSMRTLTMLADVVALGQHRYDLAEERCQQALRLGEELGNRQELADTLYTLSKVLRRRGDTLSARDKAEKSLSLSRTTGNRRLQAQVLRLLSELLVDLGDLAEALQRSQQSLALCNELQDQFGAVWVKSLMGNVYRLLGLLDQARQAWSEALKTASEMNHPQAEWLREQLAQVAPTS